MSKQSQKKERQSIHVHICTCTKYVFTKKQKIYIYIIQTYVYMRRLRSCSRSCPYFLKTCLVRSGASKNPDPTMGWAFGKLHEGVAVPELPTWKLKTGAACQAFLLEAKAFWGALTSGTTLLKLLLYCDWAFPFVAYVMHATHRSTCTSCLACLKCTPKSYESMPSS